MDQSRLSRYPFVPGPVPMLVTGGEGSWVHTADGRRILDGGGGPSGRVFRFRGGVARKLRGELRRELAALDRLASQR